MTYRIVKSKDAVEGDLIMDRITLRPVPEPRPVEDLTDEEWEEFGKRIDKGGTTVMDIAKKLDEIRARPRESAKEKCIREKMNAYLDDIEDSKRIEFLFSETWDAAILWGRGNSDEL